MQQKYIFFIFPNFYIISGVFIICIIMTKKIYEFKVHNELYFEFENLNSYDDFDFISNIILNKLGAEKIDEMIIPGRLLSRNFKLNELKFQLIINDDFPMDLKLLEQDKKDNDRLRQVANDILKIVKAKSSRYKPVKKKIIEEFKWLN